MSHKFTTATHCEYCSQTALYLNNLRVDGKLPACPDAPQIQGKYLKSNIVQYLYIVSAVVSI